MSSCREIYQQLLRDEIFIQWKSRHDTAYLTHFFSSIDTHANITSPWEVGFFEPTSKKITVFVNNENGFEVKPAEDIFTEEAGNVEELKLDSVGIEYTNAVYKFKEELMKYFPQEQFGDGFLILQCWKRRVVWNFTLITKSFKFANLKINAVSGEVVEHQSVELMQKKVS
ncbi:hypothetical protein HYX12_04315 [Candidatus Woesearchaeota archaeon]|nr:hypothetical protein [Candidatus Woesearchaeota archaeon]